MKLNDFDKALFDAAQPLPADRRGSGWRAALAALKARLEKAWVGLYAAPPRRLRPLV
jgi:hypothetical protein